MLKWSISNCFSSTRAELAKSPATPAPAQLERNSLVGLLKLQHFDFPNLQYVIVQTIDLPTITRHYQAANRRSAVSAKHDSLVKDQSHNGGARAEHWRWLIAHPQKLLIAACPEKIKLIGISMRIVIDLPQAVLIVKAVKIAW